MLPTSRTGMGRALAIVPSFRLGKDCVTQFLENSGQLIAYNLSNALHMTIL